MSIKSWTRPNIAPLACSIMTSLSVKLTGLKVQSILTSRESATLPNQVETRCANDRGVQTCSDSFARFMHGGNSGSTSVESVWRGAGHDEMSVYVSSKNFIVNQETLGKAERNNRESRIASGLWNGPASVNFMAVTSGNRDAYMSRDSTVSFVLGHSVPRTVSHLTLGKRERIVKGRLPVVLRLPTCDNINDVT